MLFRSKRNGSRVLGFTTIELLVVVAIIDALIALMLSFILCLTRFVVVRHLESAIRVYTHADSIS